MSYWLLRYSDRQFYLNKIVRLPYYLWPMSNLLIGNKKKRNSLYHHYFYILCAEILSILQNYYLM